MRINRGPVVALAAVILAALVAQIAVAGGSSGPKAQVSASVAKQLKKLRRRVAALEAQAKQPGPQGQQGIQGSPGAPGQTGAPGAPSWSADCNDGLAAGDIMVRVGSVCVDKYEDSLWTARTGGSQITGAIPCNANGQDCTNIFARSVAGVTPRAGITWFQAQAALANSGKRLPTNAEWQMAVRGTPDDTGPGTTPCNTRSGVVADTGANAGCVSDFGAFDMVGNVWEWVADWVPRSTCVGSWSNLGSDDIQDICGAAPSGEPGALIRGDEFNDGGAAGPLAVAPAGPSGSGLIGLSVGFRGAR